MTYIVSDKSKNDLFTDFLPLVNSQLVALFDPKTGVVPHRAVKQLLSLERRISNQGKDTIEQPRGGVIDVINAVAGACLARRPA